MTREEAIAILEVSKHMATSGRMYNQAIDMAIEALQREEAEANGYCHRIKPKEYFSTDAEDRLYIKIYADDEPSVKAEKLYQICGETQNREVSEWLKEYFPSADAVHKPDYSYEADMVRRLKESLSADAEWIPCSERLPEDGQGVLVTVDANKWNIEVGSCIYSGGTFHSKLYDLDVIAWMPLPKPYGERREP